MPSRLRTPLCGLLGIELPVVLAGMAGGSTTPELVAAVGRGGGLGTFGAMGMSPEALVSAIGTARDLGAQSVAVNVLIAPPLPTSADGSSVGAVLEELHSGLPREPPPTSRPGTPEELVAAAISAGATAVSVGLGDPTPVAGMTKDAGLPLIAMAATVDDACRAASSGADIIVAQGGEAGGHRSNFDAPIDGRVPLVGTFALVPQVVDAVDVPVIAAGGIMDGRGMVAARALGAQGVQMGTRFLVSEEAGISPAYKERLRSSADAESVITRAVSGRPARGLPNRLIESLETVGENVGWPAQAALSGPLRAAAHRADRADLVALWSGQAGRLAHDELPAEEILLRLEHEALAVLDALDGPAEF